MLCLDKVKRQAINAQSTQKIDDAPAPAAPVASPTPTSSPPAAPASPSPAATPSAPVAAPTTGVVGWVGCDPVSGVGGQLLEHVDQGVASYRQVFGLSHYLVV